MAEITTHIKSVQQKLQLLLAEFTKLKVDHERNKKLIATLKLNETQQSETIEDLQQKQLILKAALDTMDEAEKKVLDKKLNSYIKNIDKCISLLSHKNDE